MIQLTDTLQWDETLDFEGQTNEVKNFVSNVIQTENRTTEKEAIPNSSLSRPLAITYELANATIVEQFTYRNAVNSDGWAEILTYKIECYAK